MSKVNVGEHEPLEKALRRFKKKIEIEGILKTLKARKHYEKPQDDVATVLAASVPRTGSRHSFKR